MPDTGPVVTLLRHGETEWSRSGQHTGTTDIALTSAGEEQARRAAALLHGPFDAVLVSPRTRALRTAELAGFTDFTVDDDLQEWAYGDFEGMTTSQIRDQVPGWSIWEGPWKGGETGQDVTDRVDRLLGRVLSEPAGARVALVAHGHILRVIAARWIDQPVTAGRRFALDTAAVCELGWEHDYPVLHRWNLTAPTGP
jgi:broad specificity phosphatase PhoE